MGIVASISVIFLPAFPAPYGLLQLFTCSLNFSSLSVLRIAFMIWDLSYPTLIILLACNLPFWRSPILIHGQEKAGVSFMPLDEFPM